MEIPRAFVKQASEAKLHYHRQTAATSNKPSEQTSTGKAIVSVCDGNVAMRITIDDIDVAAALEQLTIAKKVS